MLSASRSATGPVPRHVGNSRLVTEPTSKDASCNCEEDRTLRAVLVGMLREAERGRYMHTRHEDEAVCPASASDGAHSLL
jgi:hypothetical protein